MRCLRDYPFGFESGLVSFASTQAEKLGFARTGYAYREYKNWRGIPKPYRCPFCKLAKGSGIPVDTQTHTVLKFVFENRTSGTNLGLFAGTDAEFTSRSGGLRLSDSGGPGSNS